MNRQQIKLLAIAAMTLEHIALVFVPTGSILYYVMRLIGRLTAPFMTFMLAEGYRYTRSRSRYLLRLAIFALISQPFYFRLAFGRAPESLLEYCTHWNVMLSLAIGLIIMMLFDSSIHSCMSIVLLGCLISLAHFCDWSYLIPAGMYMPEYKPHYAGPRTALCRAKTAPVSDQGQSILHALHK